MCYYGAWQGLRNHLLSLGGDKREQQASQPEHKTLLNGYQPARSSNTQHYLPSSQRKDGGQRGERSMRGTALVGWSLKLKLYSHPFTQHRLLYSKLKTALQWKATRKKSKPFISSKVSWCSCLSFIIWTCLDTFYLFWTLKNNSKT